MIHTLKRLMPHSLFGRALLILLVPVVLIQAVSAYIFFDRHWENVTKHAANALAGEMAFVVIQMLPMNEAQREKFAHSFDEVTDFDVTYVPDGHINHALPGKAYPILDTRLQQQIPVSYVVRKTADDQWIKTQFALPGGMLELRCSAKRIENVTTTVFLIWSLGAAITFSLIALLFLKNQIRPIRALADAAEDFGKGKDLIGFRPAGADEVRSAGRAFILMRERIRRQIDTRMEMLSSISHDLRTPLTRIHLQLEMLPASPQIQSLQSETRHMQHMIEEYLQFARGESGEETVRIDSGVLLEEALSVYSQAMQSTPQRLHHDITQRVMVDVRRQAMLRLIRNVVENALRYAPQCWVKLGAARGHAELFIDDDGPGIAPEKFEEVFKPFVRLDVSRNADQTPNQEVEQAGVGLGLSIARDIALSHGGAVFLMQSPQGGLRVIVRIPRAQEGDV